MTTAKRILLVGGMAMAKPTPTIELGGYIFVDGHPENGFGPGLDLTTVQRSEREHVERPEDGIRRQPVEDHLTEQPVVAKHSDQHSTHPYTYDE